MFFTAATEELPSTAYAGAAATDSGGIHAGDITFRLTSLYITSGTQTTTDIGRERDSIVTRSARIARLAAGLAGAVGFIALLYFAGQQGDPQKFADRIQRQLATIRGLPFKQQVPVLTQSHADFVKSRESELRPLAVTPMLETVARTLGLLAGDETFKFEDAAKYVATEGVDGYYDQHSGRLFVVKEPNGDARGLLYARELYRALQNQHFDLKTYLPESAGDDLLNADELLARKMIVESDSLYASVMWSLQFQNGRKPTDQLLSAFVGKINDKHENDPMAVLSMLDDPRVRRSDQRRRPRRTEPGGVPTFVTEMGSAAERYGINFIHTVHRNGWSEVDRLYADAPPASTEQILHPEKWRANERPVKIQWADLETHKLFADWELLSGGVLGEFLWRIVFRVNRFSPMRGPVPDGWNGDRYAVFKRRDGDDMLLLMYTLWDKEAAAAEFASAYGLLVGEKYAETTPPPTRILHEGKKVVIVEGGDESSLNAFMSFAAAAQEIAPAELAFDLERQPGRLR
jgi:hypothetical protein